MFWALILSSMFLPDYAKRLFSNVPTLFIKCADTFSQMCRHIDFSGFKCTLNYFGGADMLCSVRCHSQTKNRHTRFFQSFLANHTVIFNHTQA